MMPDWLSELYIAVLKFGVPIKNLRFYRRSDSGRWTVMTMTGINQGNVNSFLTLRLVIWEDDKLEQSLSSRHIDNLLAWARGEEYKQ